MLRMCFLGTAPVYRDDNCCENAHSGRRGKMYVCVVCTQTLTVQPATTATMSQPGPANAANVATATTAAATAISATDAPRPPAANPPVCCLLCMSVS